MAKKSVAFLLSSLLSVLGCSGGGAGLTPEQAFWNWFQKNDDDLFDFEKDRSGYSIGCRPRSIRSTPILLSSLAQGKRSSRVHNQRRWNPEVLSCSGKTLCFGSPSAQMEASEISSTQGTIRYFFPGRSRCSKQHVPAAHNQVFNVGADIPHTVNHLAAIVAEAMGKECRVTHLDPRNEVKIAFSDHSRAESAFGKRQKVSLEDGIQSMAAWVKDHGSRESSIFDDIEIPRNLPPSWARVARVRV